MEKIINTLGYSYQLQSKNDEKLYSLNESISELMESNDTLKQFESIEFEIKGVFSEKNLQLVVNYKTKSGKGRSTLFSSHVDNGAIELQANYIQAFYGVEKYNEVKDELDKNGGSFEYDYLQEKEPDALNLLAEDYLLSCSPDENGGAEFTDQDEKFFKEILEKENKSE